MTTFRKTRLSAEAQNGKRLHNSPFKASAEKLRPFQCAPVCGSRSSEKETVAPIKSDAVWTMDSIQQIFILVNLFKMV